jgi:CBS-domain-containing membrane protein
LNALRNLEYIEVKKESGEFICLVPVEEFRRRGDNNYIEKFNNHEVQRFVDALGKNEVPKVYSNVCVSLTIRQDTPLLTTLKVLRNNGRKAAAVVTAENYFVGLLTEQEIEHRIADEILRSDMA